MSGGATVELVWIEKQIEHWIRFGRIVRTTIQSRSGSTVAFDPGAVFAFVRWQANDFGTTESRIDILPAPRPGAIACCASPAGSRSNGFFSSPMRSKRSASTRPTPRRTIGATFTTGCQQAWSREATQPLNIAPGSCAKPVHPIH